MKREKKQVYAVVRWDEGMVHPKDGFTVKEIFSDEDEAVSEAERLNRLNSHKGSQYFVQSTRYFPHGR